MSEPVRLTLDLEPEVAWQLAQFCKRVGFSQAFDLTEAHLDREERNARAYQMLRGLDLVAGALRDQGVSPR